MATKAAIKTMLRLNRFTRSSQTFFSVGPTPRLDNIRVQLVIVSPRAFRSSVDELIGIFPSAGEAVQHASLQHILGTVTGAGLLEEPLPNDLHQFAFRLELCLGHDRTRTRNELRPLVAD